jgi:hypothetical protein
MTSAEQLRHELRFGSDRALHRRRTVAGLALVTLSSLGLVALYQLGILRRLPELPLPRLDAEKVNGSLEAYRMLATPDAVLGLGSYAITLGLAATGGQDRAQSRPWIPLALAAKAVVDVIQAAKLTRSSWVNYRAFSSYSLIAAAATFATLPLAVPEAATVLRRLGQRK